MAARQNAILEEVAQDLLSISPLIFRMVRRNLAKTNISKIDWNITPLHLEIINLLETEGMLQVSEIGERLQIAKAQMTKLIARLVELGIVERRKDPLDRRNILIVITGSARARLKRNIQKILLGVQENLAQLADGDLEKLSVSLRNVRDILAKTLQSTP